MAVDPQVELDPAGYPGGAALGFRGREVRFIHPMSSESVKSVVFFSVGGKRTQRPAWSAHLDAPPRPVPSAREAFSA